MNSLSLFTDRVFAAFLARNPELDIGSLDIHDPQAWRDLDLDGMDREAVRASAARIQRLVDMAGGDSAVAAFLEREGLVSANHVARMSPRRFADRMRDHIGAEQARTLHARAKAMKAASLHLFANVKGLIGSAHYRATLSGNVGDDVIRYFESIPSYQSLFGRLDYLQCEHCRSIFGPTAYFVDIMRVTDEYITYPNRTTIPEHMKLEERRPDLFDLPLTCENADTPIPYLQIVNEVLSARIEEKYKTDAFKVVATAPYPFNLPFQAPLSAFRSYVQRLGATLVRVYETLPAPAAFGTAQGSTAAVLRLAAGTPGDNGWYVGMQLSLTAGPGAGEQRRIVAYDAASKVATVDAAWKTQPTVETVYAVDDTLDVARERIGLSAEQLTFVTTANSGLDPVGAAYGYAPGSRLAEVLQPRAAGTGTISFAGNDRTVKGEGTAFTSQLAVGSQILAAGEIRTVTSIKDATELTVAAGWPASATGIAWAYFQWFERAGTISVMAQSNVVTGTGTDFDKTMNPGDQIQFAGTVRTVQLVTDATHLIVDTPYPANAGPVAFTVNPVANIDRVSVFLARTGLGFDALTALFREGLSDAELAAYGNQLLINATGEGLPPLAIHPDRADPAATVQRVVGLSLDRLDRITRFERLRSILGWTAQDLDWAIRATGETPINAAVIETIAHIVQLAADYALPVEVVTTFYYHINTTGIGDGPTRRDLFDRIYNDPALLDGRDPYTNPTPIPFDPARSLRWVIDDRGQADPMNLIIRARLTAALGVSDDALTALARWTAALQGLTGELLLNLATLSWLYRIATQARAARRDIEDYLSLLWLLFYPAQPDSLPPKDAVPATLAAASQAMAAARWASAASVSVRELVFIIKGAAIRGYQPEVTQKNVDELVDEVSRTGRFSRLTLASFVFETIDALTAETLFTDLAAAGVIDAAGIVAGKTLSYETLKGYFPVSAAALLTPDISAEEAAVAYDALVANKILIPVEGKPADATLVETFNESAPLDFLFANDPPPIAAVKREQVAEILLQVKRNILHTVGVLDGVRTLQDEQAEAGVAQFFAVSAGVADAALTFANGTVDAAALRAGLLTPPTGPAPATLVALFAKTERDMVWICQLQMSAAEIAAISSNPAPFLIADTRALSYANLVTLFRFRALTAAFGDADGGLLRYFNTSDSADRLKILAALTGWSAAQIEELSRVLWPPSSGREKTAVTVAGVDAMQAAFALGSEAAVDVAWLISLVDLRHLPLGAIGGPVSDTAWSLYEQRANQALGAVAAVVGPSEFPAVAAELTDITNVQQRDGLLGYSIWEASLTDPLIREPTDLYQLLLLDVEMGGCMRTSKIAQGIGSVQLYMQRVRMGLEPGVDIVDVDPVWWSWLSEYRRWEVNRKIFVYPENYLDPGLRSGATPLFRGFAEAVSQTDFSQASVIDAFVDYFEGLSQLAALVPAGAYYAKVDEPLPDRRPGTALDVLYWFGRSVIKPYAYHMRTVDDRHGWSPWSKLDLTIGAPYIAPVFAFDQLFAFWGTLDQTTTNEVTGGNAKSRFFTTATIHYSFIDSANRWVQSQTLGHDIPVEVGPMDYIEITKDPAVSSLYQADKIFWQLPYPLRLGTGILGNGTITTVAGLANASGTDTAFERELREGDVIIASGERRTVRFIEDDSELVTTEPWQFSTKDAQYRFIRIGEQDRPLPPFAGAGTVTIGKDITNVAGSGTQFLSQVSVGDRISIGNQVRTVRFIEDQEDLAVTEPWTDSAKGVPYTIFPTDSGSEAIFVTYGPPVGVGAISKFTPPPKADLAGRDPFLVTRDRLNFGLFNALVLAEDVNTTTTLRGNVAIPPGFRLDSNLNTEPARVVTANYDWAGTNNPRPYRLNLDRASLRLRVLQSDSLLSDNYWGDSTPAGAAPGGTTGTGYDLLYNVAAQNAVLLAVGNQPGWWIFDNGDESFLVRPDEAARDLTSLVFNKRAANVQPDAPSWLLSTGPFSGRATPFDQLLFSFTRSTTSVVPALSRRLLAGGVDGLLTPEAQLTPELPFSRFYFNPLEAPPHTVPPPQETLDFRGAYGAYFGELFLFIPWFVGDMLKSAQQFEKSKSWYEYVFNPTVPRDDSLAKPSDRYWRYLPFRDVTLPSLKEILTDPVQVAEYNDAPFDPDAIARLRRNAYAKAVVLRYIDNLIAWGDARFAEDTRESIDAATQLYVLASDLLGERPKTVGRAPSPPTTTFRKIRDECGQQIPQFLIDLENTSIARAAVGLPSESFDDNPINDIYAYFCVPENAELVRYWDTIADRLFKIRNCQNIQGIERDLALFAPPYPIDAGGGVPGAGAAPIPFYRFMFMLDRAKSLVADVVNFGGAVLSALQSKDNETLLILQNSQQRALLNLNVQIKEQAVVAAQATGRALDEQLANAVLRRDTYAKWLREGKNTGERDQLNAMTAALVFDNLSAIATTASAIAYTIPQLGSPFAMTYGGIQLGSSTAALATAFQIGSLISKYIAERAQLTGSWDRRDQEWTLQQQLATSDENQAKGLIEANDANLEIARRDLQILMTTIEQNRQMEDYLRQQFTTEQLYSWMAGRLSTAHFQAYLVALETARAVERSLQFELDTNQRFLVGSYWDSQKRGLLSGEALLLALDQMERAYIGANGRRLEIVRPVSLKTTNPKALLDLKAKGECLFETTERLFDTDYPGQYARKIKAVTVTVTTSSGPLGPINAMLTQIGNQTVLRPNLDAVSYLLGLTNQAPGAEVLRSNVWTSQQIAVTTGDAASGMFDFFLGDDRYLPFEGTGAVANWRFSMPQSSNVQPLAEIDDVVITLSYTALDGGSRFRGEVMKLLKDATAGVLLSMRGVFPERWQALANSEPPTADRSISFTVPQALMPPRLAAPRVVGVLYQALAPTEPAEPAPHTALLELGHGGTVRIKAEGRGPHYAALPSPVAANSLHQNEHRLTLMPPRGAPLAALDDALLVFLIEGEVL